MKDKINVAELLKDCPSGMELDCTKYSNVYFVGIDYKTEPKIKVKIETFGTWCSELTLNKYGKESSHPNAKCLIFPKGKTTWEGFVPPCKFKNGDVISNTLFNSVCIFRGEGKIKGTVDFYCGISTNSTVYNELFIKDCKDPLEHFGDIIQYNFATEEEKQKLFQAIKENGYEWNPDAKTLEKLIQIQPKFKVGDKVTIKERDKVVTITDISWRNGREFIYETIHNGDCYECFSAEDLQPYKEETIGKEISGAIIDRFICLEGYDFYDDKGNIIGTKEITMKKKLPEYPKTFEECCEILGCKANLFFTDFSYDGCDVEISDCEDKIDDLLQHFRKLLYCRNAYWKIAGEQMGLGKPWSPSKDDNVYCIFRFKGEIVKDNFVFGDSLILEFPTEEMRDAFYENFKDLIEYCKDFL